ncbi:hypothetical protein LSUE1_G007418 [Lachnellula suecica]|uniref:Alternative oxidase n=1 Tax=Lachnellula suecica TaxID=602035 RepID=A0A8T9C023_9HELO|nr:hypothetical protein LSUE1_G007418 [Lachnellula suecica]
MELPAGVNRRYASLAGFVLAALWLWVAFDRPYRFPSHIPWNIYSNGPQASPTNDVFSSPFLDSPAIRDACANTAFNESITFICDDSPGDVAEVRNSILNCVRYAMAAGAHIVLPQIIMREDYDEENMGNRTTLDYMFATEHFVGSLNSVCPKMRIFMKAAEVMQDKKFYGPIRLPPESLEKDKVQWPSQTVTFSHDWNVAFKKWLSQYIDPLVVQPIVIGLGRTFLQYPVHMEGEDFANAFGKILNFHSEIRNLAATTLLKLSESFKLKFDLSHPILNDHYFGVHLSTTQVPKEASPALQANYLYPKQSKLFLDQAANSKLSLLYVSADDGADLVAFIQDARALNLTVTSKFDLLKGWDRESLMELTPDQRATIDYLVHSKASQFAGMGHSSFAWNIALNRHQYAHQQTGHLNGEQMLSDDLSQIYGTPKGRPAYPANMWP